MTDSDEEKDVLTELEKLDMGKIPKGMFVSGWDDENDLIEPELDPHETLEKELLWAATENKIDLVESLLQRKPEAVNSADPDGYTALHKACYNNNYEMAQLLLKYKPDLNARTQLQWTPLHSAAKWNNAKLVALLLQHGANINALSEGEQTPLHVAATVSCCRNTLVELFFDERLKPTLRNNSEETAAQIAKRSGLSYAFFEMTEPGLSVETGLIE